VTVFRRSPPVAAAAWGALLIAGCSSDASAPSASDFQRLEDSSTASAPVAVAADADPRTSVAAPPSADFHPRLSVDVAQETLPRAPDPAPNDTVYRPSDQRPRYDAARAAELGIARYESKRLLLYTDIDPEIARTLPHLFDQAYEAWSEYFGPLPPDREGADYQVTGFIMQDKDRFRRAGMLPAQAQALLVHGIHRRNEFWMNAQDYDYYRRHLMVHEGTHCFMTTMPLAPLPVWYHEGMAELFGTHTLDTQGRAAFRVMPRAAGDFEGFGRVEMIRNAVTEGHGLTPQGVVDLNMKEFAESKADPYAWSWALCKFLDTHPRCRERFRKLADNLDGNEFARRMQSAFGSDAVLWVEWELFVRNLVYGYDIERAAIDFRRGEPLPGGGSIATDIRADAGWQSSGVWVEAGRAYSVAAAGQVTLAQEPKPWISEPAGISIRYASGKPIGRLVAGIQSETPPTGTGEGALWKVIDVGPAATITPTVDGTLYFRVNDFWNELADNQGEFRVTVTPARE
jgi:hypothetical protein